jgi:uncharacterized protein
MGLSEAGYDVQKRLEAARTGGPDACYELGLMFSSGTGVDVNLIEAHKWFNLAALHGDQRAVYDRAEVAAVLSPAEIARAQRMARQWLSDTRH